MSKEYEEKRGPRGADEHTEKRFPRERRAEERVPMRERDAEADGLIEGRNAVTEALRAGTPIDKIFIARGETDKTLGHIASTARAAGVVVVEADRRKLDYMSATKAHQGVIALAAVREYASVEDILSAARERGEAPLLVVCDEISDPHNLGAIIRTAECAGAHGVIIPKRRSAGLTSIVGKTSAGAVSYLPVARVPNIPALLKELQQQGVWIFGTAAEGTTSLYEADLKGPAAIVIGSEGDGMGRLVREGCDFLVSIPMKGRRTLSRRWRRTERSIRLRPPWRAWSCRFPEGRRAICPWAWTRRSPDTCWGRADS
ncbi:rNA methyltransferase TrmH family group 3 [Firmicutes bacterium CAG:129]|nr:rNA methyltransferase TrmH family group 3 [Firmicutes bacterium CAG:129]